MWFGVIIGVIIWVAIAFWPARVAARKGHSFLAYFILSLVFFPLTYNGLRRARPATGARLEIGRQVDCLPID